MLDPKVLQAVPLFEQVSAPRLERMRAAALVERYDKGAVLFRQGQRAEAMWIVLEGWVHLMRSPHVNDGSHAVVLFTITSDEVLCGISAIKSGTYNLSAVAGTACRVVRIPGEVFNDALTHEPEFAYQALRLCARRIQHIAEQYGAMAEPVGHRIVRAILRLQHQFGRILPVTHRELAQMSWTTTESAIRVVRRLKQQGYVTGSRGQLVVKRSGALARVLTHHNGRANL